MPPLDSFQPPPFLKNAHVQTTLGSSKLRTLAPNIMRDVACQEIINTSEDIKLDLNCEAGMRKESSSFSIKYVDIGRVIMSEDKTTDILKSAILMEKRGQAFYEKVAQQTSGNVVKRFFEMMANEEKNHIHLLSKQFKAYQDNKQFDSTEFDDPHESEIAAQVISKEIKSEISAADYEAAAISAAMAMEESAIKLYSDRAAAATDPNEKALYSWLAKWETQHLNFLADIDRELTEDIWFDQNFWPF